MIIRVDIQVSKKFPTETITTIVSIIKSYSYIKETLIIRNYKFYYLLNPYINKSLLTFVENFSEPSIHQFQVVIKKENPLLTINEIEILLDWIEGIELRYI